MWNSPTMVVDFDDAQHDCSNFDLGSMRQVDGVGGGFRKLLKNRNEEPHRAHSVTKTWRAALAEAVLQPLSGRGAGR
jgi:hypothetical protein